jgi:hypothetical protein
MIQEGKNKLNIYMRQVRLNTNPEDTAKKLSKALKEEDK